MGQFIISPCLVDTPDLEAVAGPNPPQTPQQTIAATLSSSLRFLLLLRINACDTCTVDRSNEIKPTLSCALMSDLYLTESV